MQCEKFTYMGKSIDIQLLEEALQDATAASHPHVPAYAIPRPKLTDTTANGLTRCIIEHIRLAGWQAERINTTGIPKEEGGRIKWRTSNTTKGSADISATINGRSVKIEVKIGRDRQSEKQQAYQQAVERSGGLYYIATNYSDFVTWYNEQFSML